MSREGREGIEEDEAGKIFKFILAVFGGFQPLHSVMATVSPGF